MPYGSGYCPECGVKFNVRKSSVGTVKRCQACGAKFIIHVDWLSSCASSIIGLVVLAGIGFACCGGLGSFVGTSPVSSPAPRVVQEPITAEPSPANSDVHRADSAADSPPLATKTAEAVGDSRPSDTKPATVTAINPLVRKWSDMSGKFSTEANFGGMTDGVVTLHKPDGTSVKVELERLSIGDQLWIKERSRGH